MAQFLEHNSQFLTHNGKNLYYGESINAVAFYPFDLSTNDTLGVAHFKTMGQEDALPFSGTIDYSTGIINYSVKTLTDASLGCLWTDKLSSFFEEPNSWSLSFWFKLSSSSYNSLFEITGNIYPYTACDIKMDPSNNSMFIRRFIYAGAQDGSTFSYTEDFDWHHYVITYNSSTLRTKLYLDAELKTYFDSNISLIPDPSLFLILGCEYIYFPYAYSYDYAHGCYDQMRVFNGELPQSDINILYNNGQGI